MNSLSFNEKELSNANQRDLMNFMSMLSSDDRFKNNGKVFVNKFSEEDDNERKAMKTVSISFQFFKGKEKVGKSFVWKSYRSKEFACSNSSIHEII